MVKASQLKVGDRIRITAVPGEGIPHYTIQRETVRVYKKIIARKRPVRISKIDDFGLLWYEVKFRRKDGEWEYHSLAEFADDTNWVPVKPRKKNP